MFAIEFTLPVWVLILAIFILGEKLTSGRVVVIVLGFIGALVILRPGLGAFQPASLLVLVSSFCYAVFNVYTKQMTATDTTFGIVFWMNLMQFPVALAGSDPLFILKLEPWQILPAIGVGIVGLSAHFCMAKAFGYGDASLVVPLDFLRVPLIAVVGWLFFGEIRRCAGLCRRHDHPVRYPVEFAGGVEKRDERASRYRMTRGCPSHSEGFSFRPALPPLRGRQPFDNHRGASFRSQKRANCTGFHDENRPPLQLCPARLCRGLDRGHGLRPAILSAPRDDAVGARPVLPAAGGAAGRRSTAPRAIAAKAEQIRQLEATLGRQQAELDRATQQSRQQGCEASGFFQIFGGAGRSEQCGALNNQISQMRANLARSQNDLQRLQSAGANYERDGQRRAVIQALAQNDCGPQYRAQAAQSRNLFETLFGPGPGAGRSKHVERGRRLRLSHGLRAHLRRLFLPDLVLDLAGPFPRRRGDLPAHVPGFRSDAVLAPQSGRGHAPGGVGQWRQALYGNAERIQIQDRMEQRLRLQAGRMKAGPTR